jgi:hypothetical protein
MVLPHPGPLLKERIPRTNSRIEQMNLKVRKLSIIKDRILRFMGREQLFPRRARTTAPWHFSARRWLEKASVDAYKYMVSPDFPGPSPSEKEFCPAPISDNSEISSFILQPSSFRLLSYGSD